MEEKSKSSAQNGMYYGLITGAALVVFSLILYLLGQHNNKILGNFSFILLIGGMVWGTLEYRKTARNGIMSYGNAFLSCFMIGLFASIIASVYVFFFAKFIYPGYCDEILTKAREGMEASSRKMSEADMETALKWTRIFTSPLMMVFWSLFIYVPASVFFSLILAIFLKKENNSIKPIV